MNNKHPLFSFGRGDYHVLYQGESIDDMVMKFMDENHIPGMSLAIVQAPYIPRVVGYGLASVVTKQLVAGRTLFCLGQMTQAYTAVAIIQLIEQNKLRFTDTLGKHLPHLPKTWHSISIQDLITHSSGLTCFTLSDNFNYNEDYTHDQIIKLIASKDLLFEPGTQVDCSASNYYILGWIIEKISGLSYEKFITQGQIEPLNLKNTYFVSTIKTLKNELAESSNTPFKHSAFTHNATFINPCEYASGHILKDDTLSITPELKWSATFSDSGIIASAEDVSIWDIGLAGDILVKDPAHRAFLYSPTTAKNKKVYPSNVKWNFPGHPGLMYITGSVTGYSSFLSRFTNPNELVCVTLLTNKDNVIDLDILARKIAGAFDPKLATPIAVENSECIQSPYPVKETINRINDRIIAQGGHIFARIEHSDLASRAGLQMNDAEVLIFGNPKVGTDLMKTDPRIALHLPLRVLAWKDDTGQVWVSYTDPLKLAVDFDLEKHKILLKKMSDNILHMLQNALSFM